MIPPGKSHSVRLCATFVKTVSVPGRYGDGCGGLGLSLRVTPRKSGGLSKTWAKAMWPASARTQGQWRASMRDYVLPRLARKRVDAVTTADVIMSPHPPPDIPNG